MAADFNGDGKQDLVLYSGNGSFAVALSNGDGTLKAAVVSNLPVKLACPLGSAAAGDINGDGKVDLVLSYFGDSYCFGGTSVGPGLFIALGDGDGTFKPATFIKTSYTPGIISLGRFRGLKEPLDLVVARENVGYTATGAGY